TTGFRFRAGSSFKLYHQPAIEVILIRRIGNSCWRSQCDAEGFPLFPARHTPGRHPDRKSEIRQQFPAPARNRKSSEPEPLPVAHEGGRRESPVAASLTDRQFGPANNTT